MNSREELDKVFSELPDDVEKVITEVLKIETEYLHMANPRNILIDLTKMIERVVK